MDVSGCASVRFRRRRPRSWRFPTWPCSRAVGTSASPPKRQLQRFVRLGLDASWGYASGQALGCIRRQRAARGGARQLGRAGAHLRGAQAVARQRRVASSERGARQHAPAALTRNAHPLSEALFGRPRKPMLEVLGRRGCWAPSSSAPHTCEPDCTSRAGAGDLLRSAESFPETHRTAILCVEYVGTAATTCSRAIAHRLPSVLWLACRRGTHRICRSSI